MNYYLINSTMIYNILMKYKCTLEEANQAIFNSNMDKKKKTEFMRVKIFSRLNNLLVEVLLYTKSITIEEFNTFKNKNKNKLFNRHGENYRMNLFLIIVWNFQLL